MTNEPKSVTKQREGFISRQVRKDSEVLSKVKRLPNEFDLIGQSASSLYFKKLNNCQKSLISLQRYVAATNKCD